MAAEAVEATREEEREAHQQAIAAAVEAARAEERAALQAERDQAKLVAVAALASLAKDTPSPLSVSTLTPLPVGAQGAAGSSSRATTPLVPSHQVHALANRRGRVRRPARR